MLLVSTSIIHRCEGRVRSAGGVASSDAFEPPVNNIGSNGAKNGPTGHGRPGAQRDDENDDRTAIPSARDTPPAFAQLV